MGKNKNTKIETSTKKKIVVLDFAGELTIEVPADFGIPDEINAILKNNLRVVGDQDIKVVKSVLCGYVVTKIDYS